MRIPNEYIRSKTYRDKYTFGRDCHWGIWREKCRRWHHTDITTLSVEFQPDSRPHVIGLVNQALDWDEWQFKNSSGHERMMKIPLAFETREMAAARQWWERQLVNVVKPPLKYKKLSKMGEEFVTLPPFPVQFPQKKMQEAFRDHVPLIRLYKSELVAQENVQVNETLIDEYRMPEAIQLVMVNGFFNKTLSKIPKLPWGTYIGQPHNISWWYRKKIMKQLEFIPEHSNRHLTDANGMGLFDEFYHNGMAIFTGFNMAALKDAVVIYIGNGVKLKTPIQVLQVYTGMEGEEGPILLNLKQAYSNSRLLINVDHRAELSLHQHLIGDGGKRAFVNSATHMWVAKHAKVLHAYFHNLKNETTLFENMHHELSDGVVFKYRAAQMSTWWQRLNHSVMSNGLKTEVNMKGLAFGDGQGNMDTRIFLRHKGESQVGRKLWKQVSGGESAMVVRSRVHADLDSKDLDSDFKNNNIVVDSGAHVSSYPYQEVGGSAATKVDHAVTFGWEPKNEIYYLMSRGVTPVAAMTSLMNSFVNDCLDDQCPRVVKLSKATMMDLMSRSDASADIHEMLRSTVEISNFNDTVESLYGPRLSKEELINIGFPIKYSNTKPKTQTNNIKKEEMMRSIV
eukprot:GHVL01034723.1.p1 GENE.GHVL01034723.1~~GHVL01034723.1.p1  ORF type:complete len:622 (+),score=87.28 GHVL01034723.1:167-2032(+)